MNTLPANIHTLLRLEPNIVRGRSFPYGNFSCTPITPGGADGPSAPVSFILSKGDEITVVEPESQGGNARLWDKLMEEMRHWEAHQRGMTDLPPECWYG